MLLLRWSLDLLHNKTLRYALHVLSSPLHSGCGPIDPGKQSPDCVVQTQSFYPSWHNPVQGDTRVSLYDIRLEERKNPCNARADHERSQQPAVFAYNMHELRDAP